MLEKQKSQEHVVEVTFSLPAEVQAESVSLVGDFNNWDETIAPMERRNDGSFSLMLLLPKGIEYEFRYLVNGNEWHNDWHADRYVPNQFGGDNSVVAT